MTGTFEVTRDIFIKASPETVFSYLTEEDKVGQWFGEIVEIDARPGGRCYVAASSGVHTDGEFKEIIPYEKVVFTWGGMTPSIPKGSTTVEITLKNEKDGTRLTLRHYDVATKEDVDSFGEGWPKHALPYLKIVAEGGTTEQRCFRAGGDCEQAKAC